MNIYKKNSVSSNTYTRYICLMKCHIIPAVGKINLQELKSVHIQRFYNDLFNSGMAYVTRKHVHAVFNQALKCAVNEGIIEKNVALNTIKHKDTTPTKEVEVFTPQEQLKIINSVDISPIPVLVRLALGTGCRLGELLALSWDDIDFDQNIIHIRHGLTKGNQFSEDGKDVIGSIPTIGTLKTQKSKRDIPIADSTAQMLRKYKLCQKSFIKDKSIIPNYVFLTSKGGFWKETCVRKKYQLFLENIGVPYHKFHALRHTYATRLLENDVHPKVAQELLGHTNVSVTMDIYSHVLPEVKREAMDRISEIV